MLPLLLVLSAWCFGEFWIAAVEVEQWKEGNYAVAAGDGSIIFVSSEMVHGDRSAARSAERSPKIQWHFPANPNEIPDFTSRGWLFIPDWARVEFAGFLFGSIGHDREEVFLDEDGAEMPHFALRAAVIPMYAIALLAAIPALPLLVRTLKRMMRGGAGSAATPSGNAGCAKNQPLANDGGSSA